MHPRGRVSGDLAEKQQVSGGEAQACGGEAQAQAARLVGPEPRMRIADIADSR
jgi:hypothetical protein